MDLIAIIFLSFLIHKLCKQKDIGSKFWIYRFVSLSVGFELSIGLIFLSIYGITFMNDVDKVAILGGINLLVILAIFFLVKRNISKMMDKNDDDEINDSPPEKDLSYFR